MLAKSTSRSLLKSPPRFVFELVNTRLMQRLSQPRNRVKLLSIVAPIGYGKTAVMTALYNDLQSRNEQCIWIGLDDRHITVDHLLASFDLIPEKTGHSIQSLIEGDTSIERQVEYLVDTLAEEQQPTNIFIDNLNACTDKRLGALLDALIFRTASPLRFIWSSTSEPDFNFGRARLEGLIQQIGLADLSFDEAEVKAILGENLTRAIAEENIRSIMRHTEGWPAAIRMMQIILSASAAPTETLASFSGTDEDIVSLLRRQVMGHFSEELRQFLLRLGLLRNFSQELCCYAIGDDRTSEHLSVLLSRNVFMIPLDRNRNRYRLHNMFREYLATEAVRLLNEEDRSETLRRASEWSERNEDWHDAVDYALGAGDFIRCKHLLDVVAEPYVREQANVQQYVQWVQQLEVQGGVIGFEAHFWYVWALVFQRHHELGRLELERLAANLNTAVDSDVKAALTQRVLHLRICLDLFTDRLSDTEKAANQWLRVDGNEDAYSSGSIRCVQGICLSSRFEFSQARHAMLVAQPLLLDVGGPYTVGWISLIDGAISALEGNVANGYREILPALTRTKKELGPEAPLSCAMACVASFCAVEMYEFNHARRLLELILPNLQSNVLVDHAAFGLEAAIKLWNGGSSEQVDIKDLRQKIRSYSPRLTLMFSCFLIQRLITLGETERAQAEALLINLENDLNANAEGVISKIDHPRFKEVWAAAQLDLLIAKRQFRSATTIIARELSTAKQHNRHTRVLELELASASVAQQLGKSSIAAKSLTSAVRRASKRRLLRPFFDYRESVSYIVTNCGVGVRSFALKDESQFFDELCLLIGINRNEPKGTIVPSESLKSEVIAPTQREAELLSLLDTGLSNTEIASYTNLSTATVKWHLKNLYRKLNVTTRAAAMARSRDLGLLPK